MTRTFQLSRRARGLAVCLFVLGASLTPALAADKSNSSSEAGGKPDGKADEIRTNTVKPVPAGQGARRSAFEADQSLCDVAPPCPKGCKEDTASRTCVETQPTAR